MMDLLKTQIWEALEAPFRSIGRYVESQVPGAGVDCRTFLNNHALFIGYVEISAGERSVILEFHVTESPAGITVLGDITRDDGPDLVEPLEATLTREPGWEREVVRLATAFASLCSDSKAIVVERFNPGS